ncbi:MAG: TlpA disulfide reductase family protein [Chitinophagaceae bacterium]
MKYLIIVLSFFLNGIVCGQSLKLKKTIYRAVLHRQDGNEVVFNMDVKTEKGKTVFYVINDTERIRVTDISQKGDSLFFNMPVFESSFFTKINKDGSLNGTWVKGTRNEPQRWPFTATPDQQFRFKVDKAAASKPITGKWLVTFTNADGSTEKALALFKQVNHKLSGSILTTTGDYRYLDGIVTNDSLKLSTFDGSHAYTFTATIVNKDSINGGMYYFGPAGKQSWTATKDNNALLPEQDSPATLRKGETSLNFAFNDLNDKTVSLKDDQFKDKVVIVELMGSWCPNCMDETKFLSEFYRKNKKRGVEVIALAYEYTTDVQRSKASLEKFRKKFNMEYPVLLTGVAVGDEQRTEKTLPQITPIRSFPTTIILDKKGNVRDIQSVFYGPGTGAYYTDFVRKFNETIDGLLKE